MQSRTLPGVYKPVPGHNNCKLYDLQTLPVSFFGILHSVFSSVEFNALCLEDGHKPLYKVQMGIYQRIL
jgi:hypothetical protein